MVVFNDPVPVENSALQAVLVASKCATLSDHSLKRGVGGDTRLGGIAHGFATLGTIGFERRFDYAAIGTVSNVASRLCDEAKPGQILISPRVLTKVEKAVTVEPIGEFELKGIRRAWRHIMWWQGRLARAGAALLRFCAEERPSRGESCDGFL
jgi:adenylate cyclase